jgi:peptidoglycan/xylan/chitin deacetylase (PgdA/CDA1 family)
MSNPFYSYSPIVERPVVALPEGKRIAVWFGLNIEHYEYGQQAMSLAQFTAGLTPDPLNYGWRDYGPRVGVWRMIEAFDALGVQPTAIVNSDVVAEHPSIVKAGVERGWAWVAHGRNNSGWWVGMDPETERTAMTEITDTIANATGARPRGWLGPALTAGPETNNLLAGLGYDYNLDWGIDDVPVDFTVRSGRLLSLPYSTELNDIPFYALHGMSGPDFRQALVDAFDQLYAEGATRPRVMGVGVHPFLTGQPYRMRYLTEAIRHMQEHSDVWFANADQIADWDLAHTG